MNSRWILHCREGAGFPIHFNEGSLVWLWLCLAKKLWQSQILEKRPTSRCGGHSHKLAVKLRVKPQWSVRNVLYVFTQFGLVQQFKTHLWMLTATVGPAFLTYCGRGMTGDHKQSRTGQLQGTWFSMNKYYRGNTTDISLCNVKFNFHVSPIWCTSLKHSNDCNDITVIFNLSMRTNNSSFSKLISGGSQNVTQTDLWVTLPHHIHMSPDIGCFVGNVNDDCCEECTPQLQPRVTRWQFPSMASLLLFTVNF